ncbi:hypothetical protein KQI38_09730 [Tissierella carlieri]|uniref:hypothetical protein n=1 Tax=Tissierella carlieri TaxID=689904 RepID=UPI001C102363|nr:hypothetical protein [Tissierella carlieri]MBU5312308.1 hypothetical protein [Tissierella carlieri]
MGDIFEKKDLENQKEIDKIKNNIAKAEAKIEKIKPSLRFDSDIEEYSDVSLKIRSYQEFIEKNKEQIEYIINNPYTKEDCIKRRDEIQREYNVEFKKAYSDIVNQILKLCNSIDKYEQITNMFLRDRNNLNANAAKIDFSANVYEGEGIKNDYYSEYRNIIIDLKKLINLNKIQ